MKQTRILLLDDHELFRECLALRLESEPDFWVAAGCGTVEEALGLIAHDPVDLVLLDMDLGAERGSGFLERALARGFQGRVLIVTGFPDDPSAARLIGQGVHGIFLKQNPPALLIEGIRAVMDGRTWVDPSYWRIMQRAEASSKKTYGKPKLSERERKVLQAVMEGLANKEIATRLEVSEASVKASLQQLFEKSGARTRSQLVRIALENWQDSSLR